jgi:hypothetical protein
VGSSTAASTPLDSDWRIMSGLIKFPPARSARRTSICSPFLRFSPANLGNKARLRLQEGLLEPVPAEVDPRQRGPRRQWGSQGAASFPQVGDVVDPMTVEAFVVLRPARSTSAAELGKFLGTRSARGTLSPTSVSLRCHPGNRPVSRATLAGDRSPLASLRTVVPRRPTSVPQGGSLSFAALNKEWFARLPGFCRSMGPHPPSLLYRSAPKFFSGHFYPLSSRTCLSSVCCVLCTRLPYPIRECRFPSFCTVQTTQV